MKIAVTFLVCSVLVFNFVKSDWSGEPIQELKIEVVSKPESGCERKTKRGDKLKLHYSGYLFNGSKFDSSVDRDKPLDIQIGVGQVIRGWDNGLMDMCAGEIRKLHVPSEMAYGKTGAGDKIPPNTALLFEVEALEISDGPKVPNVFKDIDVDADNNLSREELEGYLERKAKEMGDEAETMKDKDKILEGIFIHEDKNMDGIISFDEFSGPKHEEL